MAEFAKVSWSFADLGPGGHPPFYIDSLRFISQFFGLHDSGLRLIGIICFLLNLIIMYQLSLELFKNKNIGLLACLIFAIHPMAIRGSMILDIDNTILTVLLMTTILYFIKNIQTFNLKKGIFLILLFFLCLWAKLSTPLILMGSLVLFYILKKDKIKTKQIFIIGLSAVLFFLFIWKLDSLVFNFPFSLAFNRPSSVVSRGISGVSLPGIQELFLRILRVSLWIGIYMMVFWALIIVKRIKEVTFDKKEMDFRDLLIIYSFGIFMGYTLIGGLSFGFAKYQYPLLPIVSIIIASTIKDFNLKSGKNHLTVFLIASLTLVIINVIILPDPIYQINYHLRKISIFSPDAIKGFLKFFGSGLAFGLFSLFLAMEVVRRLIKEKSFWRPFCFLSLTFIILNNCFADIYLWKPPFFTTYCYGRNIGEFKEISNLCRNIAEKDKKAKFIAPEDILYDAEIPVLVGYEELWNNRDRFLKVIKEKKVTVVIYAFTYNAVFSYWHIFLDPSVLAMLKENFTLRQIGEYSVWIRK